MRTILSNRADDALATTRAKTLLSRLHRVRRTGHGRWIAQCPAHNDKNPSLSIRETSDGTILLRCFAGCGASAIVGAINLTLADLFPNTPPTPRRGKPPFPSTDILQCIALESIVVYMAGRSIVRGESISALDFDRLKVAVSRIQNALDVGVF